MCTMSQAKTQRICLHSATIFYKDSISLLLHSGSWILMFYMYHHDHRRKIYDLDIKVNLDSYQQFGKIQRIMFKGNKTCEQYVLFI